MGIRSDGTRGGHFGGCGTVAALPLGRTLPATTSPADVFPLPIRQSTYQERPGCAGYGPHRHDGNVTMESSCPLVEGKKVDHSNNGQKASPRNGK